MQRCGPGFLRASQNEIEPLDFVTPGSKHRRNVIAIFCSSYSMSRSFWSATAPSRRFWGHRPYARKAVRRRRALPKHFVRNQKKWPQLSRTPRHFMLARDFTKTVLHRYDLRHWLVRVRSCRRRDVAFQRAAAETAHGKISVRTDTAVAWASAKGQCPIQLRRQRLVHFRKWTRDHESPCWGRHV